jgi:hypothetical protein
MQLHLLSLEEKRCAINAAKEQLEPQDKMRIDILANDMVSVMKARNPGMQFTKDSALELIAMLGIFFNRSMK